MKNKSSTILLSIKTNDEIVQTLKSGRKLNLPFITIWLTRQSNKSQIQYALLVNKTQFKLAVVRNRVKRQIRNILINSQLIGGVKILLKPNITYLKKTYSEIETQIIKTINKYQNGK
ncbi:MAG: ribonuclease P protein component [Mycoplasmoidaceae bacterium]|nr:ribonuclease P protein component [Mycoplasmoidaceae bacterium]